MRRGVEACLAAAALASPAAFLSGALLGQNTGSQHIDNGTRKMMRSADAIFAIKAAQSGMAEVQLGQLAAQKAGNPDIKAFGQQMVNDHPKSNNNLKAVAQSINMNLPSSLNGKDEAEYIKLQGLSGADFDREYVKDMLKDHEGDVKEFQKEVKDGKDPQIRNFASQTLPALQQHLSKIKTIQASMSGAGASK